MVSKGSVTARSQCASVIRNVGLISKLIYQVVLNQSLVSADREGQQTREFCKHFYQYTLY